MNDRLAGRNALVTGATSNIGKAIAIAFAAERASVVVAGRDPDRGAAVVSQIRAAGGTATFVAVDLDGSRARCEELATAATEAFGPVDILVNNAGVYPPSGTLSIDEATFDLIVDVNVKATFFLTAAVVPAMLASGSGVIINLGSWGARLGIPFGPAYAATKGAVETLTRAWSAEFGPSGVRVNAISPGVTFEAGSTNETAVQAATLMATSPYGALIDPSAVAVAAVYLASDDASAVHGTVLDVDGGRSHVLTAAR
jgi:NAD(P)-dependent dehydrogenase (short-subunit alcohol dehydrogenase family)